MPKIEVSFEINANGMMNLSAVVKSTGKSVGVIINNDKGRLSKMSIESMKVEAEEYKRFDEAVRKRDRAKNWLESYFYNLKNSVNCEGFRVGFGEDEQGFVRNQIEEICEWIESNSDATLEQFMEKQNELERIFNPIMQRLNARGSL